MYNYDLAEILKEEKLYKETKAEVERIILANLDERRVKTTIHIEEGKFFDVTLGNLWTILALARPFVEFQVPFTEEFLVDVSDLKAINEYFNSIISYFTELDIDVRESLLDVLSELAIISSKMLGKYGATANLYDIIKLMERHDRFRELINFNFKSLNQNLQFEEMNKILDDILHECMDILKVEETCYKNLSLTGLNNERQLRETLISIGPKPDDKGNIIPEPVDTSYVKGQKPFDFLIDAFGGRKALITNFKQVKDSGYLTRKLTLLCLDNIIQDIKDCGTKHTVDVDIPDNKTLFKLQFRKYIDEQTGEIKTINPKRDTHLIGTTIKMRSVIKCACEDGVCKTCYGDLWKYNYERNAGIVAVLLLTDPLTQMLLSAKHLLQARASKIEWGINFEKFFTVNKDQVLLNSDGFKILIPEFIEEDDNYENTFKFNHFFVDNGTEKFTISTPVNLIINNDVIDIEALYDSKEECYVIDTKDLMESDVLFNYVMENNELSASLLALTNLIETNHFIKGNTIDATLNEFIRLLNESPIGIHFVHVEMILKEMCKITNNDRTLFATQDEEPIEDIYRITEALVKNPSLSKSLVYQELHKQLTQMLITFSKNKPSLIDDLLL